MKPATASALLLILLGLAWLGGSHSRDTDMSTFQKRAGGADQNYNYNQQAFSTPHYEKFSVKTPAKGGATISSSASRVQPGLLQWVKFW